jgi:hypothetical protein
LQITPAAFDLLVASARDQGANPLDWATVLYEESGWNPALKNGSGAPYYGLNQMGVDELHSVGFTGAIPAGWLALSAEEQLPFVAKFWAQKKAAIGEVIYASAAHLLAANFLPGRMQARGSQDPANIDYPLTSKGDVDFHAKDGTPHSFYDANAIYDLAHRGVISIRSLGEYLARLQTNNPHDTAALQAGVAGALARSGIEPGPTPEPVVPSPAVPVDPGPPSSDPNGSAGNIAGLLALVGGALALARGA